MPPAMGSLSIAAVRCLRAVALVGLVAVSAVSAGEKRASAWFDEITGYAIGGFDPVDYFVLGRAFQPDDDEAVELYWGAVNWRFRNTGNRDAFTLDPGTYRPRFGGFDPVKLAEGLMVEGEPAQFAVYKDHLYLFQNSGNLAPWRQDPEKILENAIKNWPRLASEQGFDPIEPEARTSDQR